MANPWFKFFPTDWRGDPGLRMCSLAARGLWIEMVALMHEAKPYGHLLVAGHAPTEPQLAVLAGAPVDQVQSLLGELESADVFSRTKEGVIFSRKMTRDEQNASKQRKSGQKGGNPKLTGGYTKPGYLYVVGTRNDGAFKIGISVNPRNRLKKIRAQYRGHDLQVIAEYWVDDMGAAEAALHADLSAKNAGGEWFRLSDKDLKDIAKRMDPKGSTKAGPLTQKPEARSQILPLSPDGDAPPEQTKSTTKTKKSGHRIPEGWEPDERLRAYATEKGFSPHEIDDMSEDFRDYWTASNRKEAVKCDWSAAWRKWVRNQVKFIDERASGAGVIGSGSRGPSGNAAPGQQHGPRSSVETAMQLLNQHREPTDVS